MSSTTKLTNEKIITPYNCDNCGAYMELNSGQRYRREQNPDSKFYCDHECHMEDRERNKLLAKGPWSFLKVKTVLDNLPGYDNTEIGLGA